MLEGELERGVERERGNDRQTDTQTDTQTDKQRRRCCGKSALYPKEQMGSERTARSVSSSLSDEFQSLAITRHYRRFLTR